MKIIGITILALTLASCGLPQEVSSFSSRDGQTASIGSFNILRLGHGETKDYRRVAELIEMGEYDVFAAQEVMKEDGAKDLLNALNEYTDKSWDLELSEDKNGESSYKEYFAYFYNTETAEPITTDSNFCNTRFVQETESEDPASCFVKDYRNQHGPAFRRDPFVSHFKIHGKKFAFANAHVHFGSNSRVDYAIRHKEILGFKRVLERMRENLPGGYTVIGLGDFNLKKYEELTLNLRSMSYIPDEFFDGDLETLSSDSTTIKGSNYDHIFYFKSDQIQPVEDSFEVLADFDIEDEEEQEEFKKEVSDHLPIKAEFILN